MQELKMQEFNKENRDRCVRWLNNRGIDPKF